jgi:hypothetical protein
MSIVHKPKFNVGIVKKPPKVRTDARKIVHWTTTEIENLVELRSIGLSHKECARLLGRSESACLGAVKSNSLEKRIQNKRQELIKEALKNDAKRKNSAGAADQSTKD